MPRSSSVHATPWAALMCLALSSIVVAQDSPLPAAVRAAADGITASTLSRDLEFLASDALRGRDTGSPGFDAAATYIEARLRAAGVSAAGDNGTYRQHYDLQELHAGITTATLTIGRRQFVFGDHFVLRSLAGPVKGHVPVVYVGHGWRVPARGVDPWKGVDVRDALVLAHGPRAMPKDVAIRQIGRIAVGASSVFAEAKARGALGVIFLTPSDPKADWAAMRTANVIRRELAPAVPSAYAAVPVTSLVLGREASDALMAGEAFDGSTLIARGEAGDYPRAFRLRKRVRIHLPLVGIATERPYNVVARIEGSDPVLKEQVVTIAAHLDGAVGTRTVNGDAIYNAADDNGSGSAGLLAIAEQLMKGPRPRRTIVLLWDSGEERGLWGTRRFVDQPPVPIEQIVAHVNVDMIGATRAPGRADADVADAAGPNEVFLIGPGALSPPIDGLLQRVNDAYLKMTLNRRDDRPESEFFYPRTDAGPFLERGILTIGFNTGTHPRYHLPADEARYLDPAKMEAVARTVYVSLWALANAPERPRIEKAMPESVLRVPASSAVK